METESTLSTVTSNKDPAKGGAIKVAMPEIGGDEYPEWIEPVLPPCCYFHPQAGDTVEVVTPAGEDITENSEEVRHHGVLLTAGGYPDEFQEDYPNRQGIKTPKGHLVLFDETTGQLLIRAIKVAVIEGETVLLGSEGATEALVLGTSFRSAFSGMVPATNPAQTMALVNAILAALQATPLSAKSKTE